MRHDYVMLTSSVSGSATWVGSSDIRVGSAHPGGEDARGAWRAWAVTSSARDGDSDFRFRRGFQQWLRLFLLYTVVWSKHNFDNFHFWAKNQTPLNHMLWYQLLGNPTGDELIIVRQRRSTQTQYFTWFGKTAYIHRRESILFRDWERVQ